MLSKVLKSRVNQLRDLLPRAVDGDEKVAIHQARVTTRRLKAAIDLLKPVLPDDPRKEFSRALRRLRRMLGPLRDLDVMLDQLQKWRGRHLPTSAIAWLSERLQDERRKLRARLGRKKRRQQFLGVREWDDLQANIATAEAEGPSLLENAAKMQLRSFAFCADQLVQARGSDSSQPSECGDVHELRIAGKLLRYTLELTEHTGHHVPKDALRSFKKLQESLGKWHDYLVMHERALRAAMEEQVAIHHPTLYGEVLKLAGLAWKRSERYLTQFTDRWSRDGKQILQQVMQAFEPAVQSEPLSEPPKEQSAAPLPPVPADDSAPSPSEEQGQT
jgi:CHAD domain-containing protein